MNLLLVGCGNLGSILLEGWAKELLFKKIYVIQPSLKAASNYNDFQNIHFAPNIERIESAVKFDIIVLACKPQIISKVIPEIKHFIKDNTVIVSLLAGITTEFLKKLIQKNQKIVRFMPNIALKTKQSVNLTYGNNQILEKDIKKVEKMIVCFGTIMWLKEENMIDLLTPISASGPAYFYLLAEILVQLTLQLKVDEVMARDLVKETLIGAASLITENNHFTQLINNITSKGGVTEAALKILNPQLPLIMAQALRKAHKRVRELSNENCN